MKRALKSAAPLALLIGEAEASSGQLQLKNLQTNSSELVELHQLAGLIVS